MPDTPWRGSVRTSLPGWVASTHYARPMAKFRGPSWEGFFAAPPYVSTQVIHPIRTPLFEPPFTNNRTIVAVQRGPFARVVNTEGTCLNIRAEPSAAQVLDCAAEGVLLRDLGARGPQRPDAATNIRTYSPLLGERWSSSRARVRMVARRLCLALSSGCRSPAAPQCSD
jgi:hypothetical protein